MGKKWFLTTEPVLSLNRQSKSSDGKKNLFRLQHSTVSQIHLKYAILGSKI